MSYWKRLVEWCQEPSKIKIRTFNPRNVMVLLTLSIILASSITFARRSYFPAQSITLPADTQESALVQFTGDIITAEGTTILDVNRSPEGVVIVHSCLRPYVPCVHVETTPGLWSVDDTLDFVGDQEVIIGIHINKSTGEAWVTWRFGGYTKEDLDEGIIWHDGQLGLRKYMLEGYGQWEGESMPYGTITVGDEAFKISLFILTEVTEGEWKGSNSIECKEVWSGRLSFTVTIDPLEEG
jgi:hypothetical protein